MTNSVDQKKFTNILLLGQIGSGKTSFINSLVNHLQYDSLCNASKGIVHILAHTEFTIKSNTKAKVLVKSVPNVVGASDLANTKNYCGIPSTRKPVSYVFPFQDQQRLCVVDTPGFGGRDEYDKETLEDIISFISSFDDISAVLIFSNPDPEGPARKVINLIMEALPKSAANNIFFAVSRQCNDDQQYKQMCLRYFENISDDKFCFFDMRSFFYLCAKQQQLSFTQQQVENFEMSWNNFFNALHQFFKILNTLPTTNTKEILKFYNIRKVFFGLSNSMAAFVHEYSEKAYVDSGGEVSEESPNNDRGLLEQYEFIVRLCTSCVSYLYSESFAPFLDLYAEELQLLIEREKRKFATRKTKITVAVKMLMDSLYRADRYSLVSSDLLLEELFGLKKSDSMLRYIRTVGTMNLLLTRKLNDSEVVYISAETLSKAEPASSSSSEKHAKDSYLNVLVLGETGVGKSTFINGLVNYLNYDTLNEARKGDVHILIRSKFVLTDVNYRKKEILSIPNVPGAECELQISENVVTGQSATMEPRSYIFPLIDRPQKLRIIDTPGIADTRGIEYDKNNMGKILHYISGIRELHAICILLKPNNSRLSTEFKFCLNELFVHLHKSAARNILFCFTNSRATLYRPGDTLAVLEKHLDDLRAQRDIEIKIDRSSLYCFDNESFRFLCAIKKAYEFTPSEIESFKSSWEISVKEAKRMFNYIANIPTHRVEETLSLNNTRNVVLSLAKPLAEITRVQGINFEILKNKIDELRKLVDQKKNLENKLRVQQLTLVNKEMDEPQTVCTSQKCVEYKSFESGPGALTFSNSVSVLNTVYKTVCHKNCYLEGVEVAHCPNVKLQRCAAIDPETLFCNQCGCSWQMHMHIRYKIEQVMQEVVDTHVENLIRRTGNHQMEVIKFIAKLEKEKKDLQEERNTILTICASFALFLSQNALLPYNDSYKDYIDFLIADERNKANINSDQTIVAQLEACKAKYLEEVRILTESIAKADAEHNKIKIENIDEMIKKLHKLRHCGKYLDDVRRLEILNHENTSFDGGFHVPVRYKRKGLFQHIGDIISSIRRRN